VQSVEILGSSTLRVVGGDDLGCLVDSVEAFRMSGHERDDATRAVQLHPRSDVDQNDCIP
jgi:hypothetical protein